MKSFRLLPEWAEQDGVMLTWPHQQTDWAPILEQVEPVYLALAKTILTHQQLVIVANDSKQQLHIQQLLSEHNCDLDKVHWLVTPTNDTWARDHGPITLGNSETVKVLDFCFNGWGNKYPHELDNRINQAVFNTSFFKANNEKVDLVLEGGGIEINEHGVLLTTSECLLNPNRNPQYNKQDVTELLQQKLGAQDILWLDHGYLAGDDTDSHIDTLARFAPDNTIVYVACDDINDEHFDALAKMRSQLESFRDSNGEPYRLLALPWPSAKYNSDNERLPATYANYLIINNAVLVPTYRDDKDQQALNVIAQAYPSHQVIAIDCLPIIHQFGSLHCITMQLPKGTIARNSDET